MTVFSMNRNRKFRAYQRIDQFQFFLACMSGYVCILEDNFCALHGQFIDHLRYTLFVTGNRIRTKDNRVSRFDRNFAVDGSSDTRQCCHRLSLASGRYKYNLFIGIVFHFFSTFFINSINSFPYFSFLYSPIPLMLPNASIVVGCWVAIRCKVLSDKTI